MLFKKYTHSLLPTESIFHPLSYSEFYYQISINLCASHLFDDVYSAVASQTRSTTVFIPAYSQSFYVNAWWSTNLTYEFTVGRCDIPNDSLDMTIYTCKATGQSHPTWVDSTYTYMAIDAAQNIWYVMLSG